MANAFSPINFSNFSKASSSVGALAGVGTPRVSPAAPSSFDLSASLSAIGNVDPSSATRFTQLGAGVGTGFGPLGTAVGGGIGAVADIISFGISDKRRRRAEAKQLEELKKERDRQLKIQEANALEERRRFAAQARIQEEGIAFSREEAARTNRIQDWQRFMQAFNSRISTNANLADRFVQRGYL